MSKETIYLNKRIEEIISYTPANSPTPPVIILQGDHGAARSGGGLFFTPKHHVNLNAYYLPGGASKALYPNITLVNSFRVVFDRYFNASLPLEKDTACFSPGKSFACQVVIDPNPICTALK